MHMSSVVRCVNAFAAPSVRCLIALVVLLPAFAACSDRGPTRSIGQLAPPVEATQARYGSLPLVERLSGNVRAENQVMLYAEIPGRIAAVLVNNGESVSAGQILVRLQDDAAREQVRQADAGLRIERARQRQSEARLGELNAQVARYESLSARNLVSEMDLDTLLAQRETALAEVELAQAQVERAAATLAEREDAMAKTIVRAPIDGVVGGRAAEVGMQVSTGAPLYTLGNPARVIVRVNLTDVHLRRITVGMPVRIAPEGDAEDEPLEGVISRISPFLDIANRSAIAEIDLTNPSGRLWPGMFVPVDVFFGQSRQATLVPTSALFTDPNTGREGVFQLAVAPGGTGTEFSEPVEVSFLPVIPLARGEHELAVENLETGAWVVTLGQNLLATGRGHARVRSVTWDHVMHLQGLHRDLLLAEVIRDASAPGRVN